MAFRPPIAPAPHGVGFCCQAGNNPGPGRFQVGLGPLGVQVRESFRPRPEHEPVDDVVAHGHLHTSRRYFRTDFLAPPPQGIAFVARATNF